MANYCSFMVTEKTFRVEDPTAFENELQRLGIIRDNWQGGLTFTRQEDGSYWIGGYDCDLEGWGWGNPDADDPADLVPTIQKHMRIDTIWVVEHVGYEKLCYVTGWVQVITKRWRRAGDLGSLARQLEQRLLLTKNPHIVLLHDDSRSIPF